MDATVLAYIAILIALLAYPIELMWKKLFSIKTKYYVDMLHNLFMYSRYTFALLGLIIARFKMEFDKEFVFVVVISIGVIVVSLVADLVYSLKYILIAETIKQDKFQKTVEERLNNLEKPHVETQDL